MKKRKRRKDRAAPRDVKSSAAKSETKTSSEVAPAIKWYRSTLTLSLASGLLLWASFPPLGWWPLAWVAPVGWLILIRRAKLDGRRPYRAIWLAGCLHWLVLFQFIRLPHPALYFGWVILAAYLGVYMALFVGLARVAVHRLRISLLLAAPLIWVGFELARGHLFSGLSLALLGHSQVQLPIVIQLSDLCGAYGLSFLMMLVAACLARMLPIDRVCWTIWPAAVMASAVTCLLVYGNWRLTESLPESKTSKTLRVAMIQGSIDTILDLTEDEAEAQEKQIRADYRRLTIEATREQPDLDLIIWPESKFTVPDVRLPDDPQRLRLVRREVIEEVEKINAEFTDVATDVIAAAMSNSKKRFEMLVGTEAVRLGEDKFEHYNAALLLDPIGEVKDHYFKMHRVPFGEYVLFDEWIPWIYRFVPIPGALTPGERPVAFDVAGLRLAPSVCFESTVPHLIRRQIDQLTSEGTPPDVLINITDDGWFLGSTCLDLHLACSIFRAVEHRLPMLVAANTGFSAWIDGNGRVLSQGPRRQEAVVQAHVQADGRPTWYRQLGDWPAIICLVFCGVCGAAGIRSRRAGEQEHGI